LRAGWRWGSLGPMRDSSPSGGGIPFESGSSWASRGSPGSWRFARQF